MIFDKGSQRNQEREEQDAETVLPVDRVLVLLIPKSIIVYHPVPIECSVLSPLVPEVNAGDDRHERKYIVKDAVWCCEEPLQVLFSLLSVEWDDLESDGHLSDAEINILISSGCLSECVLGRDVIRLTSWLKQLLAVQLKSVFKLLIALESDRRSVVGCLPSAFGDYLDNLWRTVSRL